MIIFIPTIFLLITFSIAVSVIFKLKMEQSIFLTICFIIILLLIFGLLGFLKFGLYTIYVLMFGLIVWAAIKIIKDKKNGQFYKWTDFVTPGVVVFLLSAVAYRFACNGSILCAADDPVHWAKATLYMYRSGNLYYGVQTLGVPLFNYFLSSIAGYSEPLLFTGRWVFIWAAFCLPMSEIGWNKWYKALVYAIMAYMICGTIHIMPKIYMDLPLGAFAGGVCAYWAIDDRKRDIRFVILIAALLVTPQIKNIMGFIFAFLIFIFAIIVESIYRLQTYKGEPPVFKHLIFFSVSLISVMVGLYLSLICREQVGVNLRETSDIVIQKSLNILGTILPNKSFFLLMISALLVLGAVLMLFVLSKKPHRIKLIKRLILIFSSVSIMLIILVIIRGMAGFLSSISDVYQKYIFDYYNNFWGKGYWGQPMRMLLPMLLIFATVIALVCFKKEYKTQIIVQSIYMIISILIVTVAIGLSYIYIFSPVERKTYAEFHRYLGGAMVFVMTWLIGFIALCNNCWIENRVRPVICLAALMLLLVDDAPLPGEIILTPYSEDMLLYKYVFRSAITNHSKVILENTEQSSNIYTVSVVAGDNTDAMAYIAKLYYEYEITPRQDSWNSYSETFEYIEGELRSGKYDYLYIHYLSDEFIQDYGYLFADPTDIAVGNLYKVNASELIPLVLIN